MREHLLGGNLAVQSDYEQGLVQEVIKSTTHLKLAYQVASRAHFMQVSDYEGRKIFGGKGSACSKCMAGGVRN